jgi:hypothetical protein
MEGDTVSDTVDLAGLETVVGGEAVEWTVTGSLLGPVASVEGACDDAVWTDADVALDVPVTAVTVGEDKTSTLTVGEFTVPDGMVGCYTYTETLTGVFEDGTVVAETTHEAGDVAETFYAWSPTVSTYASARIAVPGLTVTDTVLVEGLPADFADLGLDAVIAGELLGPIEPGAGLTCQGLDWTDAPVAADIPLTQVDVSTLADGTVTMEGVGAYLIPDDATVGCYTYAERLWIYPTPDEPTTPPEPSEPPTPDNPPTPEIPPTEDHPPGDNPQTFIVANPTITTQISEQTALVGETVSDTVFVTGLVDGDGTVTTWTVTGALLGPVEPVNQSCAKVDWTDAPTALSIDPVTIPVADVQAGVWTRTGLGTYMIPDDGAGCYTYTETLTWSTEALDGSGVLLTQSVTHEAGKVSQTVTVTKPEVNTGGYVQRTSGSGSLPWLVVCVLAAAGVGGKGFASRHALRR